MRMLAQSIGEERTRAILVAAASLSCAAQA